ncbi:MAG: hypothetical protein ABW110_05155, partial [Steroidobacteraceae bacterium]
MRARTLVRGMLAAGLTIGLQLATTPFAQQTTPSGAPATEAPQANRGGGRGAVDPRVQQRTYMFEDSNE